MINATRRTGAMILFCCAAQALSISADSLLQSVLRRWDADCLNMRFDMSVKSELMDQAATSHGKLLACKPRCFRLELGDMFLVSDGTSQWHYSKASRQVMIAAADSLDPGFDPSSIMKTYANKFNSVQAGENAAKGLWEIHLSKPKPGAPFSEGHLWIEKQSLFPRKISITDQAGNSTSFRIVKMEKAEKVSLKDFEFQVPAGAEVFDQRK